MQWVCGQNALEGGDEIMVADRDCRKSGRSRVAEALRKGSKRNRRPPPPAYIKERRVFPAIAPAELKSGERLIAFSTWTRHALRGLGARGV